jgi:hypothetical protein
MNPLETYIRELHDIRSSGAAVKETSYYGPLATLLNGIGKILDLISGRLEGRLRSEIQDNIFSAGRGARADGII